MKNILILPMFLVALAMLCVACGETDGVSACAAKDGIICNNCASDCNISCGPSEDEYCVGLTYFGDDTQDNLRCTFCE